MKILKKFPLALVFTGLTLYPIFIVVSAEFDPFVWPDIVRQTFGIIWGIATAIVMMGFTISQDLDNSNKNEVR